MRRAVDIGWSPWVACAFFVIGLNYLMFLALASIPGRLLELTASAEQRLREFRRVPRVLDATWMSIAIGVTMVGVTVGVFEAYNASLFVATPFVMGAVAGYRYNRHVAAEVNETLWVLVVVLVVVVGTLFLLAAEGAVCLILASPIALAIAGMGALLGRNAATSWRRESRAAWIGALSLPLAAGAESLVTTRGSDDPLREVRSAVEIDASPEVVWSTVLAFPPLPEPSRWIRASGIAYPMRAEIVGSGVGAVRHCVFSTGAFVEPITAWEPGRRLAFDVAQQPPPLVERSLYRHVTPPHLDGYLRSERGEFRLVALANGRTRLEGSTWYRTSMRPGIYWAIIGDGIIHGIHHRVLEHVARVSEAEPEARTLSP
jgi:hypothetical protein